MGCGISRFDPEEAVGPTCKFEPILLKRRVQEIAQRQRSEQVLLVTNLSFKHLLLGDENNEKKSPDNHHGLHKRVSSPIEIIGGNEKSPDNRGRKSVSSPIEIACGNEKSPDNHGRKSVSLPIRSDGRNEKSPDNHGGRKSVSSPIEIDCGNEKSPDNHGRKSVSSPIRSDGRNEKCPDNHGSKSNFSPIEQTDGFVKGGAFRQDSVKVVHSDNKRVDGDERDHNRQKEREADREKEEEAGDEFGDEDGKTDEEEGEYSEREDSLITAPGSPSFRDYCLGNGHSSKHDDDGDGGKAQNNPRKEANIAHMTSRQGSATRVGKNGRNGKGRKFGNVLSKGSPKSGKSFWNVSACYNPNYSASRDIPGKLPGKSA